MRRFISLACVLHETSLTLRTDPIFSKRYCISFRRGTYTWNDRVPLHDDDDILHLCVVRLPARVCNSTSMTYYQQKQVLSFAIPDALRSVLYTPESNGSRCSCSSDAQQSLCMHPSAKGVAFKSREYARNFFLRHTFQLELPSTPALSRPHDSS